MSINTAAITTAHKSEINYYFWLFILLHTVLWTIGPALLRPSIPHDTLEGITWGLQWQLGYSKHPFLAAWLCAGITQLFEATGWPTYLLAQLAVSLTFIAVWKLAQYFLSSMQALVATLVLEGIVFYNINSFNFTPDTLQSPLWALLSLFFYRALTQQNLANWLYTAIFAALCLCTKYQIVILLLPMGLLCLFNPTARKSFSNPYFYCAIGLFLLLATPHFIWLYQHDFITVHYASSVSAEYTEYKTSWTSILYPLNLLVNTVLNVLGLFILLWPFYKRNARFSGNGLQQANRFQWQFLLFLGFGPMILTFTLCLISGDYFPPRWLTPYFFLLGIISLYYLQPVFSKKNLRQFAITFICFSTLLFIGRLSSFNLFARPSSDAFLPNKTIALTLSNYWNEQFHTKLPFLAGSNYLVTSVIPYMQDRPQPFLNWDVTNSPWIREQELVQQGGIFIWDAGKNYTWDLQSKLHTNFEQSLIKRFPGLIIRDDLVFYRLSDKQAIRVGLAILPPAKFAIYQINML